jgi:hypothetical protein
MLLNFFTRRLNGKSKASLRTDLPWRIDQSIDVDRVTLEDVKLIFSQSEKRLDDTVKTGENIASKTMSMITLLAGVMIALIGYIISNWKGMTLATHQDAVAITGSLYCILLSIFMIRNVLPNKYYVLGSEPKTMMNAAFFDPKLPAGKTTIFIYMNEIENYNLRIEKNLAINKRRWRQYRLAVNAMVALPVVLGILYVLLDWLF